MLLSFQAKNYKSFADGFSLSMIPAKKQRDLSYSILSGKAGNKVYKALSSSIIYGANASGKSNVISAIDAFKEIVLRRDLANHEVPVTSKPSSGTLELIPNKDLPEAKPVEFAIKFVTDKMLFEYGFAADVGRFLTQRTGRRILTEYLRVNDRHVFRRTDPTTFDWSQLDSIPVAIFGGPKTGRLDAAKKAAENVRPHELFLMNGFRNIVSPKLADTISSWLEQQLIVICNANEVRPMPDMCSAPDWQPGTPFIDEEMLRAAERLTECRESMGYVMDAENSPSLWSLIEIEGRNKMIPADSFESYGTIRFMNLFPLVKKAFSQGATLIVDEFDASLHPVALHSIISAFHNDDLNLNRAQFVLTTHNPCYMNASLFRRDEIKLVERDPTGASTLYSLADFGTSGQDGVRNGDPYMNNYLRDMYGGLPDTDLGDILGKVAGAPPAASAEEWSDWLAANANDL